LKILRVKIVLQKSLLGVLTSDIHNDSNTMTDLKILAKNPRLLCTQAAQL
jgi:hypothetical protein